MAETYKLLTTEGLADIRQGLEDIRDSAESALDLAQQALGNVMVLTSQNLDGTITLTVGDTVQITPGAPSEYEYVTLTFPS